MSPLSPECNLPSTARASAGRTLFYLEKQKHVAVRHVSDDRVVAVIEIVSPANKHSPHAVEQFVRKSAQFLSQRVHLVIADPFPPTPRDPDGLHVAIWRYVTGLPWERQTSKRLELMAYEADATCRAFLEPFDVGEKLVDMPLFLWPGAHIELPLEATYQAAFDSVPRRWREVLDAPDAQGA